MSLTPFIHPTSQPDCIKLRLDMGMARGGEARSIS